MSKWIAEFDLEDGDTMPEHMDLNYMGAKIDFHCRPIWISVSKRLPGDSGTYLVTVHDGRKKRTTFARYQKKLKNWVMTGARAYWRVKAWMSLPKPYEPQGRSDKE